MTAAAEARELARWYELKPIPEQIRLIESPARFKVVPAGRRSGKTERAKRHLVAAAAAVPGDYFAGAPTHEQVKRIFWKDLKLLTFSSKHTRRPSESELKIWLPNESTITLLGLDEPARIEGNEWRGGVIDEFGNLKRGAWEENIEPALNTVNPQFPDYRAWCWLLGVPEGLNHYYDRARYASSGLDPDWDLFHWNSSEVLPPDVIAAAKRSLSARQYRQEYEASFEGATGRIYDDYSNENHTAEAIQPHDQLLWMHDFNFTPLSSAIGVIRGDRILILDEIVLEGAVAAQSAIEFIDRYKDHGNKSMKLYGDPAGRAGEKHGHASDYTAIEDRLRSCGWTVERCVRKAAPAIRDRQNAVRAKICSADGTRRLFVNPERAKVADKGLSTVQLKKGSAFIEDETYEQHITTAIGYMIAYEWPISEAIQQIDVNFHR